MMELVQIIIVAFELFADARIAKCSARTDATCALHGLLR